MKLSSQIEFVRFTRHTPPKKSNYPQLAVGDLQNLLPLPTGFFEHILKHGPCEKSRLLLTWLTGTYLSGSCQKYPRVSSRGAGTHIRMYAMRIYLHVCVCVFFWVAVMLYDKRLIIGIQRSEIRKRVLNTLVRVGLSYWKGFGQKTTNIPLGQKMFSPAASKFPAMIHIACADGELSIFSSPCVETARCHMSSVNACNSLLRGAMTLSSTRFLNDAED